MSKETFDPRRYNPSENRSFSSILERSVSRRQVLKTGTGMAALSLLGSFGLSACNNKDKDPSTDHAANPATGKSLGFNSIPGSKIDAVSVAEGYSAEILAPWGTPLDDNVAEWQADGSNSAQDQKNAIGMHHDGMRFFPLNGSSSDGILCINHEYIDKDALHFDGATRDAEYVRKEINAHGISVVRIQLDEGSWKVVANDPHNRRFTAASEMEISGPLAGTGALITPYSADGTKSRGTLNNCGNGYTPWGTYLSCEENWPGYFVVDKASMTDDQTRIGLSTQGDGRYNWHDQAGDPGENQGEFARFNVTPLGADAREDYRNEANGFGYIVEIDPYDNLSIPVKRTAMGRFRHEGCVFGKPVEGKPLAFYSGHDARFEYLYKYVSDAKWDPKDVDSPNRLATGDKYLDSGTLYAARFDEDGTGIWLALTLESPTSDGGKLGDSFASLADIILNTAGAADLVGATPMDRPEWTAVDPVNGSVYLTLTNNTRRTESTNPANPRLNNAFGHIIRWDEVADSNAFNWDIFVFGAPADGGATVNLSALDDMNQFAGPDGLVFDERGIMWVQTDNGADEVEQYTNDQMLAVIPSTLTDSNGGQTVITANNQAELRRFFVGPNGCEVTGLAFTPDLKNMFINIQHPDNWPIGNNATEATPGGTRVRPRSSTVVIRKMDDGEIGV